MEHAPGFSLANPRSSIRELATPALNVLWGDRLPFAPGQKRSPLELARQELFSRICVRDPYFALCEVMEGGPGEVTARVPVEQEPGAEASPMCGAEVVRHLSILGSCAASRVNPTSGQSYYLPRRVRLECLHPRPLAPLAEPLWAHAKAEFQDRRLARALTLLSSPEGQPLFSVDVDFNVLSAEAFQRLFQGARQELRREPRAERDARAPVDYAALRQNPHRQPPPLRDPVREGECLQAMLGPVGLELCKGHFAQYPVLPVAMVVSGLSRLAGTLLRHWVDDDSARYLVTLCDVRAESLAYAGETVRLDAHRLGGDEHEHHFDCWASVGNRVVGTVALTLLRVRP
jgi:3-hydroxymyristoyl/3-hydroxydecanoyl-(acyl carrier protein) dehydratase